MGFESIPFLITIISGIGAVAKAVWDFVKTRAVVAATILATVFPWIIRQIVKYFSWKYVLWAAIAVLVGQAVMAGLSLASNIPTVNAVLTELNDLFPGISWYLFDGPMQLRVLLDGIPSMLSAWVACVVACFVVRKVKWAVQIGLSNVLKGAGQ